LLMQEIYLFVLTTRKKRVETVPRRLKFFEII
jgi:hypothetical protein